MSNSTRQQLRARMRILLNDPDGDKWDDDVLNELLRQHISDWRMRLLENNPEVQNSLGQVNISAYGAATSLDPTVYTDLPGNVDWWRFITSVRDVTQSSYASQLPGVVWDGKGFLLKKAKSILELKRILDSAPNNGYATHWYVMKMQDIDDNIGATYGLVTDQVVLLLAPVPTSARLLNLTVQAGNENEEAMMSSDTCTTGLPDYAERPYMLQCAIDARMMEQNPNVSSLEREYDKAERRFRVQSKKTMSPEDNEMEYDENLIY